MGEQTCWLVQLVGLGREPQCWEGTSHPSCHQLYQLGGSDPGSILPQRLGTDAILSSKPHLQYHQSKAATEQGLWVHSRARMGKQGTPYPQSNPTCPLGQQCPEESAEKHAGHRSGKWGSVSPVSQQAHQLSLAHQAKQCFSSLSHLSLCCPRLQHITVTQNDRA